MEARLVQEKEEAAAAEAEAVRRSMDRGLTRLVAASRESFGRRALALRKVVFERFAAFWEDEMRRAVDTAEAQARLDRSRVRRERRSTRGPPRGRGAPD